MERQAIVLTRFGELCEDSDRDRCFISEQIDGDHTEAFHCDAGRGADQAADVVGGRDRWDRQRRRTRLDFRTCAHCENLRGDRRDGRIAIVERFAQQRIRAGVGDFADACEQCNTRIAHRHTAVGGQSVEGADHSRQPVLQIGRRFHALGAGQNQAGVIAAHGAHCVVNRRQRIDGDVRIWILRQHCEADAVLQDTRGVGGPGAHLPD